MQLIFGGFSGESVISQGNGSHALPDLSYESHKEADTRIFAHLTHCVQHYGYSHAVIQATDTNILLMTIYHSVRIPGKKKVYKVVMSAAQDITALATYGDTGVSLSD